MTLELVIVGAVVLASIAYLGWTVNKGIQARKCGGGCDKGCGCSPSPSQLTKKPKS